MTTCTCLSAATSSLRMASSVIPLATVAERLLDPPVPAQHIYTPSKHSFSTAPPRVMKRAAPPDHWIISGISLSLPPPPPRQPMSGVGGG